MNNQERDEFLLRCLNGAANLYGVLTCEEFVDLYNSFIKNHESPLDEPTNAEEVIGLIDRATETEDESFEFSEDVWCRHWQDPKSGVVYVVYRDLAEDENPDRRIPRVRANWIQPKLRVVTEEQLLAYDDPQFGEDCQELTDLANFINSNNNDRDMADIEASAAQAQMRVNGAAIGEALFYFANFSDYRPADEDEYMRLVGFISRLESVTRTWNYRGYTQQELARKGILSKTSSERIPTFESIFGEEEYEEDDVDDDSTEKISEDESDSYAKLSKVALEDLPPPQYTGPIDFSFVKNRELREKIVEDYKRVSELTRSFVRTIVMHEMTSEERKAAFVRLGFDKAPVKNDYLGLTRPNRDMVAGDFGSMMDDQNGDPAIKRILKQAVMDERSTKAASYYANYRYTWLEVLAAKAGVGLKCRDLLTNEELFLMECSLSLHPDIKGKTLCCGIGPIGGVYMLLGVVLPANFENPSAISKIVLTYLGIETTLPIVLSFADQARFAAETIHRIDANGKLGRICFGILGDTPSKT